MTNGVRIVENPISGKILVIMDSGDTRNLARQAADIANKYPDSGIKAMFDMGVVEYTPEDLKGKALTAADVFDKISDIRGTGKSYMFDAAQGQSGTTQAKFNKDAGACESIFFAALDAVMLSRELGTPVEFEFRNRKVSVTGTSDPVEIEKSFPANERTRAEYVAPPRQFNSVKDRFNTEAQPNGSIAATYKDPKEAQKHIYYIGYDLADLSHEFGGATVRYNHVGNAVTATDASSPQDVEKQVPAKDAWPACPKR